MNIKKNIQISFNEVIKILNFLLILTGILISAVLAISLDFEQSHINIVVRSLSCLLSAIVIILNYRFNPPKQGLVLLLLLFLLLLIVLIFSFFPEKLQNFKASFFTYFIKFFCVVIIPSMSMYYSTFTKKEIIFLFKSIVIILTMISIINMMNLSVNERGRIVGILPLSPIFISQTGCILSGLSLYSIINYRKFKTWSYIIFIIGLWTTFIASSKTGLLALGIVSCLNICYQKRNKRKSIFLVLFMASLSLIISSFFWGKHSLASRIFNSIKFIDISDSYRVEILKISFYKIFENPLMGNGFLLTYCEGQSAFVTYSHNLIIEAFYSGGVFMGGLFLLITFVAFRRSIILFNNNTEALFSILFLVYFVFSFFNSSIYFNNLYYILLSFLLAKRNLVNDKHFV